MSMRSLFAGLLLPLLLLPHPEAAGGEGSPELPFKAGERLTYELKWGLIPAGTAVLEVLQPTEVDGAPAHHFSLSVRSNSFVDHFYMVRDTIEAFTDEKVTRSLGYTKRQHEGKTRRDITVRFDWQKEEAQYSNFGKLNKPVKLLPGTLDPLSVFYAFRRCDLKESAQLKSAVSDGKKVVVGTAIVLQRQLIRVNNRSYDTFLVEPDLKDVGGVFKKSRDAKLQIWVTNDSRKLPVRIASRVVVGSFVAELASIEHRPLP